ncbi:MAG: patatin-like phospholipase family protein [Clostridia bacterium]|nr:patatin-like phospholipase family protein [Clostridia bacterium]
MKNNLKIGLALSGGAMRGLAHIGALEVLEENNIPIHMIAGTSMGSLVGGLYACGMRPSMMRKIAESVTPIEEKKYIDLTIPRMGLIKGKKIEQVIYTLSKGVNIEDTQIPYRAIACCLEDNNIVSFDRGSITTAIRCSIAIPGIFEPVFMKGKTYVDGGVLDRVPIEEVRKMGADYIIDVDVNSRGGKNKTPKTIFDVLFTVFEMMEWQAMEREVSDADADILPKVRHINPASLKQAKECIDLGREAALESIEQIKMDLSMMGYSF